MTARYGYYLVFLFLEPTMMANMCMWNCHPLRDPVGNHVHDVYLCGTVKSASKKIGEIDSRRAPCADLRKKKRTKREVTQGGARHGAPARRSLTSMMHRLRAARPRSAVHCAGFRAIPVRVDRRCYLCLWGYQLRKVCTLLLVVTMSS
uniref:Putative secreted protein n=1 Tax=Ixodes ricinus TaxID=34613 RepID=A0A6B0UUN9_IXORI